MNCKTAPNSKGEATIYTAGGHPDSSLRIFSTSAQSNYLAQRTPRPAHREVSKG